MLPSPELWSTAGPAAIEDRRFSFSFKRLKSSTCNLWPPLTVANGGASISVTTNGTLSAACPSCTPWSTQLSSLSRTTHAKSR